MRLLGLESKCWISNRYLNTIEQECWLFPTSREQHTPVYTFSFSFKAVAAYNTSWNQEDTRVVASGAVYPNTNTSQETNSFFVIYIWKHKVRGGLSQG